MGDIPQAWDSSDLGNAGGFCWKPGGCRGVASCSWGFFSGWGRVRTRLLCRDGDAQSAGCLQSSPGTSVVTHPPGTAHPEGPAPIPPAPYGNQPPLSPERENQRCSVRAFLFGFFFLPTLQPKVAAFSSFMSFLCCCGRVVVTQAAVTLKK